MKVIGRLKNSGLQRGLFAARSAVRLLPSLLSGNSDPREVLTALLGGRLDGFIDEVGELKGSFLKAAQILSLYGEYYFSPEINEVLRKVQSQSHFLGWEKMRELLPAKHLKELEIAETPLAAASIGQVHRARIKATGEEIVLKVQYPGIRKAIDLDVRLIRTILSLGKFLPKGMSLDGISSEIRRVLEEEMDYPREVEKHEAYRELLLDLPEVLVPKLFDDFCTETVIASAYFPGRPFTDPQFVALPQGERDRLGALFFRLYLREVFCGLLVQTDAHPGNFLYHEGKVALVDFGALLEYPESVLVNYRQLIRSAYHQDRAQFFQVLRSVSEIELNQDLLWKYLLLATSPLRSRDFDWGATKLPDELLPLGIDLVKSARVDDPPHDFIFLDRRVLGLFSMLRLLRARFDVRAIAEEYLAS